MKRNIKIYSETSSGGIDTIKKQKLHLLLYVAFLVIVLIVLALDISQHDIYWSHFLWIIIPCIMYATIIDNILMEDLEDQKTKTSYEQVQSLSKKRIPIMLMLILCFIIKCLFLYGQNPASPNFYVVFLSLIALCILASHIILHEKFKRNGWIVFPIIMCCLIESYALGALAATKTQNLGRVVNKNSTVYFGYYLNVERENDEKWYTVYGRIYEKVDIGDNVILISKANPLGINIIEVITDDYE